MSGPIENKTKQNKNNKNKTTCFPNYIPETAIACDLILTPGSLNQNFHFEFWVLNIGYI